MSLKLRCLLLAISAILLHAPCNGQEPRADPEATRTAIMDQLEGNKDDDLNQFLSRLLYKLDMSHLSDQEIEVIISKLQQISESDPYLIEQGSKDGPYPVYPNRNKADRCIFRLRFQQIANPLRALSMEERVDKIFEGITNPPDLGYHFDTQGLFLEELVFAGPDAVPFIIEQNTVWPPGQVHLDIRQSLIPVLVRIGDPRCVPYLLKTLADMDDTNGITRADAAKALIHFGSEKVVEALIDALNDRSYMEVDRHMPQSTRVVGHQPYNARYYMVRHAAAESLTKLTGHNWGLVYNEDYLAWSSWLHEGQPSAFNPRGLERNEQEKEQLVEFLYHRYMSARPNPWQPHNDLATKDGIESIADDLEPLGKSIAPLLQGVYNRIITVNPIWKDELQAWTGRLILALPWDD